MQFQIFPVVYFQFSPWLQWKPLLVTCHFSEITNHSLWKHQKGFFFFLKGFSSFPSANHIWIYHKGYGYLPWLTIGTITLKLCLLWPWFSTQHTTRIDWYECAQLMNFSTTYFRARSGCMDLFDNECILVFSKRKDVTCVQEI